MDTYWKHNENCVRCGICVKTCTTEGYNMLNGGRNQYPYSYGDVLPCHRCGKCQEKCPHNAIIIERW